MTARVPAAIPPTSPYSREKQHVLMSIDVERSDKRWTAHLLAAIQYLFGVITTDETPGAKAKRTN